MSALQPFAIFLLGTLLGVFATCAARAAELTWDAPSGCPDRDALRWRVEEALGTTLEKAAPLNFSAKVREKSATRWVVALDVASDPNQAEAQHRELEAPSCDELAQAVSVAIALALGADVSQPNGSPSETPSPAESDEKVTRKHAAPAETHLSSAAATQKRIESARPIWWATELGPVLDFGSLPGLAPGIEVSGLVGKGALGAKLGGLALPNRTTEVDSNSGGTFTLLAASLMACGNSSHVPLILRLCAGSEFGRLSGKGINITQSKLRSSSWLAPRIDLAFSLPLLDETLRLFGSGTIAMPLIRKEFTVTGLPLIHQPDAVIGRLGAGLELLWR